MSRKNHQIAGDMHCKEPVQAEETDEVCGSGNQAQNEWEDSGGRNHGGAGR